MPGEVDRAENSDRDLASPGVEGSEGAGSARRPGASLGGPGKRRLGLRAPDSMSTSRGRSSSSEFLARLERVARLFGGLARDGTSSSRLRVVAIIAMSFLGASAQAGTIAALNFFVKGIESDLPRLVPYLGFPIGSDARTLVAHRWFWACSW
jgi:hypothetical protein